MLRGKLHELVGHAAHENGTGGYGFPSHSHHRQRRITPAAPTWPAPLVHRDATGNELLERLGAPDLRSAPGPTHHSTPESCEVNLLPVPSTVEIAVDRARSRRKRPDSVTTDPGLSNRAGFDPAGSPRIDERDSLVFRAKCRDGPPAGAGLSAVVGGHGGGGPTPGGLHGDQRSAPAGHADGGPDP